MAADVGFGFIFVRVAVGFETTAFVLAVFSASCLGSAVVGFDFGFGFAVVGFGFGFESSPPLFFAALAAAGPPALFFMLGSFLTTR